MIREMIVDALAKLGMTDVELSLRCDGSPSPQRIGEFKRGKRDLQASSIERMLIALGFVYEKNMLKRRPVDNRK